MLIQFGTEIGNFFRETFIDKFDFWLVFGLLAQLVFAMRFIVQWISSERAGRSVVPRAFWYFSISGAWCCSSMRCTSGILCSFSAKPPGC